MPNNEVIGRKELAMLCRQFAGMLEAGMDLLRIIEVFREQTDLANLRSLLDSIEKDVRLGRLLSTAMGRFPEVFSPFFVGMIRQGEREDALEEVFIRLAEHLETETDLDVGFVEETPGRFEMHYLIDRVWILLFWLFISVALVSIGIAVLWYITNADMAPRTSLGPNICLLVGVFLLTSALLFSRFKPLRHRTCLFCGRTKDQVERLVIGIGAAICDLCIRQQHDLLPAAGASSAPPEPSAPVGDSSQASDSSIIEALEEDIPGSAYWEETDIEVIKEESYPY